MTFSAHVFFSEHWTCLLKMSLLIITLFFAQVGWYLFYHVTHPKWVNSSPRLASCIKRLHRPVKWIMYLIFFLCLLALSVTCILDKKYNTDVVLILKMGIMITLFGGVYIFCKEIERWIFERWPSNVSKFFLFSKIFWLLIIFLSLLLTLPLFGVSINGILALGGFGGLIFGFFAKDFFLNFLGGASLIFDRPFNPGDFIADIDSKIVGKVEFIGWRWTKLRTVNKQSMLMPNSVFLSTLFVNRSRNTHVRMKTTICLCKDSIDKVCNITSAINSFLDSSPDVDSREPNLCYLSSLLQDALILDLTLFFFEKDLKKARKNMEVVLLDVYRIIQKEGGALANPIIQVVKTS